VSTNSNPRVLITDDNPQGAELLEAYLADLDCETKIASNGEEALKAIASWNPDVVLLDIMMPKLSGFEVCRQIRSNPATRSIGILMVTALDAHADIDRAVDVGTDDLLTKPINKAELVLRVRALLKARAQSEDLPRTLEYIRSVEENLA
jgi:two-component system alkaline phosphatase synthesis response regulator PhoP